MEEGNFCPCVYDTVHFDNDGYCTECKRLVQLCEDDCIGCDVKPGTEYDIEINYKDAAFHSSICVRMGFCPHCGLAWIDERFIPS